jgi:flagellar biosynthetic protein FliQ
VALGVGLIISLFQALTQIQEATLSFVPKIVAIMFAMIFFGPYIFAMLQDLFMLAIEHIATG